MKRSYVQEAKSPFIGRDIKAARVKAGITIAHLAGMVGVQHYAVEAWECGLVIPTGKQYRALGRVLPLGQESTERCVDEVDPQR